MPFVCILNAYIHTHYTDKEILVHLTTAGDKGSPATTPAATPTPSGPPVSSIGNAKMQPSGKNP